MIRFLVFFSFLFFQHLPLSRVVFVNKEIIIIIIIVKIGNHM